MAVEENKQNDEAEIKRGIEGGVEAIRDKNIEGVMSLYAREVVSFDIVPPLRYVGADAFRKPWKEVFSSFQGPIGYEMHDLTITVGDDVAFTHSLNRIASVPSPLFTAAVTCLSASAGWYLARSGDGAASRTAK